MSYVNPTERSYVSDKMLKVFDVNYSKGGTEPLRKQRHFWLNGRRLSASEFCQQAKLDFENLQGNSLGYPNSSFYYAWDGEKGQNNLVVSKGRKFDWLLALDESQMVDREDVLICYNNMRIVDTFCRRTFALFQEAF